MANWKKVFIDKSAWTEEVMMKLTEIQLKRDKGVMFTTQYFSFDGGTIALMIGAFVLGLVIGIKI